MSEKRLITFDKMDEIWLDWEGKQVSREEAKEYVRNYGRTSAAPRETESDGGG